MSTQSIRTNIIMSIYPKHVANIANRTKNHEFRKYLIPTTVTRVWIYETTPTSAVRYCVDIEQGKQPGEIPEGDLDGLNNREFNEGKSLQPGGSGSKYAYKISALYRLKQDLSLNEMKQKGWLKGPPQKYNFAPEEMVLELSQGLEQQF